MTPVALTVPEVADILKMSERSVYRLMDEGKLPYWAPTPRKRYVSPRVLERLIAGESEPERAA
jgi:excisionase family DNA binding protein